MDKFQQNPTYKSSVFIKIEWQHITSYVGWKKLFSIITYAGKYWGM